MLLHLLFPFVILPHFSQSIIHLIHHHFSSSSFLCFSLGELLTSLCHPIASSINHPNLFHLLIVNRPFILNFVWLSSSFSSSLFNSYRFLFFFVISFLNPSFFALSSLFFPLYLFLFDTQLDCLKFRWLADIFTHLTSALLSFDLLPAL